MSLAIGYTGQVSMSPEVMQNPLGSIVPNNITVSLREINAAVSALQYPRWPILNRSQRKFAIAYILNQRGDQTSLDQSQQVLIGNPAFALVQIVP